jgi:Zn-dependent protease
MFTWFELIDLLIITVALSFIFKDSFKIQRRHTKTIHTTDQTDYQNDPLFSPIQKKQQSSHIIEQLKDSAYIVAPAIILHELGHKLMAVAFGFSAVLKADYLGLGIGIALKLFQSPILFFVPAYVSWTGDPTVIQKILVAFAGPLVNILIWATCWYLLKYHSHTFSSQTVQILTFSRFVNGFLAIFNLLPIPFFDGGHIAFGLYHLLVGA